MAGIKTDAWADAILQTMDGGSIAAWTPWVGLLTAVSSIPLGSVTETTYTSYARQQITSLTGPISGDCNNGNVLTFPACTGGGPQTITHIGLYTASVAGELRYVIALETARVVDTGIAPSFQIYDIAVHET